MSHLGQGKLLVICVTCMMGSIQPGGCWLGTTDFIVGNRFIQTTYRFI